MTWATGGGTAGGAAAAGGASSLASAAGTGATGAGLGGALSSFASGVGDAASSILGSFGNGASFASDPAALSQAGLSQAGASNLGVQVLNPSATAGGIGGVPAYTPGTGVLGSLQSFGQGALSGASGGNLGPSTPPPGLASTLGQFAGQQFLNRIGANSGGGAAGGGVDPMALIQGRQQQSRSIAQQVLGKDRSASGAPISIRRIINGIIGSGLEQQGTA